MLEKSNNWITLFANLGILISLILLIAELNQNNQITRIQIEQSRSESLVQWHRDIADSEYTAALLAKLTSDNFDILELNPVELSRTDNLAFARFWDYENIHSQYTEGFISEEYWTQRIVPAIRDWAPRWIRAAPPEGPFGREAFKVEVRRILGEP